MGFVYVKDANDRRIESADMVYNKTLLYLRDVDNFKFNIGDILIREDFWGETWKLKSASCGLPYKYVYVFENELGVGYIRRLSINGTSFVDQATCVVDFDPRLVKFQLDPNYANNLLLGESDGFDLKLDYKEAKKRREAIHYKNEKLAEKTSSIAEIKTLLEKLKPGDSFWIGKSVRRLTSTPNAVVRTFISIHDLSQSGINYRTSWGTTLQTLVAAALLNKAILLQKPFTVTDTF